MFMKNKIKNLLLILVLAVVIAFTVAAAPAVLASDASDNFNNSDVGEFFSVLDMADLLTVSQWRELEDKSIAIAQRYECEVMIVTVGDMEVDFSYDDAWEFAEFLYESCDYGYGEDKSGVLFVFNVADFSYSWFSSGKGGVIFADDIIDEMLEDYVIDFINGDEYYEAFYAYLDKAEEYLDASWVSEDYNLVLDEARLLSDSQREYLEERAQQISDKYNCEMLIRTVDDMRDYGFNDIEEFSLYLRNKYDFGYGKDKSCVVLVLSMADRDYDFRVWGDEVGKIAFTFYGIDAILDRHILPPLGEDEYYKAFSRYLDKSEEYLQMAKDGAPFDSDNDHEYDGVYFGMKLIVVIFLPLIIAGIVCTNWKSKMKTAKTARTADNYIPKNGFNLTGEEDMFLYRTTTRRKIERSSSSSGGGASSGGGGSSGRSGKF